MSPKLVRLAVIGCGDHLWRGHVAPILAIPGLQIVGAYDSRADRARGLIDRAGDLAAGARVYDDADGMFHDPNVDAVIDASPDAFHLDHLELAVACRKHALIEKPLAIKVPDLAKLRGALALAQKQGLVITSCHPRRFDPPYVRLRQELSGLVGRFGAAVALEMDFSYHTPDAGKADLHTGLLMDHVNHELDFSHFLFGHAPAKFWRLSDGPDAYRVAGVRQDGVALAFNGTRHLKEAVYPEQVRLRFRRGEAVLSCKTGIARLVDHGTGMSEEQAYGATNYEQRFGAMMAHFRDAVHGGQANYLGTRDLVANTEAGIRLTANESWAYAPIDA